MGDSCKWTNDSQHILLEWFDAIHDSPSQVYRLALPFCPSSAWLHKCYATELSQEVRVIKGLLAEWGSCSRTVTLANPETLGSWENTIVVGLRFGDIITLDGITGTQTAILSGHTAHVSSFAFTSDGVSLVSGSDDCTIKFWDVQTGGVVKTFRGHREAVLSVSISADYTMIVSASLDRTIRLWDVQTVKSYRIIRLRGSGDHVRFSPMNPQHLLVETEFKASVWDIDGHQIKPGRGGAWVAFSLDGAQFVSYKDNNLVVQNTDSGAMIAKFQMINSPACRPCFSPDGRLIAAAAGRTAYIWDITSSDPQPINIFAEHPTKLTSLEFSSPSSLITCGDNSVRFWQIGAVQTDPVVADPESTPPPPARIESVTLQTKDGVAISSDSNGVVSTWDLSTGLCKASFRTPARATKWINARLINSRLISVWHKGQKMCIWGEGDGEPQIMDAVLDGVEDFRISGDGSKVFYLCWRSIQARSILTGEVVGEVALKLSNLRRFLSVDGSKVWVHSPFSVSCTRHFSPFLHTHFLLLYPLYFKTLHFSIHATTKEQRQRQQ